MQVKLSSSQKQQLDVVVHCPIRMQILIMTYRSMNSLLQAKAMLVRPFSNRRSVEAIMHLEMESKQNSSCLNHCVNMFTSCVTCHVQIKLLYIMQLDDRRMNSRYDRHAAQTICKWCASPTKMHRAFSLRVLNLKSPKALCAYQRSILKRNLH